MPVNTTLSPTSCLRSAEFTPSQAITMSAATGGSARPDGRFLEHEPRAALVLLDAGAEMVGDDAIRPEPLLHGAIEREMQRAAMDADFRILVAGRLAARLLVDELAEAVEEAAFGVLDSGAQQFIAEAERGELAHRMRQQRDADAELLQLRRRLVDAARDPARMQIEREREPANPAADDRDGHVIRHSRARPKARLRASATRYGRDRESITTISAELQSSWLSIPGPPTFGRPRK